MQIQLSEDCWFTWLQLYSFQNKDCGLLWSGSTRRRKRGGMSASWFSKELPSSFLSFFFFLPNLTKHQHIWFTAGHEVTLRYTVFSSLTWPRIMTAFIKYWSSLCFLCNLRHNKKKPTIALTDHTGKCAGDQDKLSWGLFYFERHCSHFYHGWSKLRARIATDLQLKSLFVCASRLKGLSSLTLAISSKPKPGSEAVEGSTHRQQLHSPRPHIKPANT